MGIYKKIGTSGDLNDILSNFFKVLASKIYLDPKPVYSEIFEDASGLGKITSLSMAVFDKT